MAGAIVAAMRRRSLISSGAIALACWSAAAADAGRPGPDQPAVQNQPIVRPPAPVRNQPIVGPWIPAVGAAKRYASGRAGEVSFAIVDWAGRYFRFHGSRTAPSASVIKAMLLVAYLRRAGVRNQSLTRDERALLRPMIRRSDNGAASLVSSIVGARRINRLARAARMRDFRFSYVWGLSRISPRDQARFMYRLERFVPRRHRRFALRQLARITPSQRWGIGRVKPPGWGLYFKGGWGGGTGWVNHQVALLKRGDRRVSLAIFTESNPSHGYGKQTLRGVAARLLRGLAAQARR